MAASSSLVRCAVIGLGMGTAHASGYLETPEAKLVAVCDSNPKRLAEWKGKVSEEGLFSDYKQMLKTAKPDLVSVVVPNYLHAPVTINCLRAGAHVLCEKPMALNTAQARAMAREAEKARRKLGINLSFRFTPQARALKDLADAGFLGRVYHASTRWTRREGVASMGAWFGRREMSGGGSLIDLGVHRIDLAIWLMGAPQPVSVSATTHQYLGRAQAQATRQRFDVEDSAAGFIRFNNGVSLVLAISWFGHQAQPEMMATTVMGTKGTLVHRNEGGGYQFVGEFFTEYRGHRLAGTVSAANPNIRSAYGEMVRAIAKDTAPLAGAEDGVRMQRILDALYRSARTGREVRIR